ncbi:hypothetical protein AAHA92_20052 [Salvia divinorum]|uniref:RING-CH-type domain-containing protein n=1 Tax=Salvia divinorum TaxID=28513 RepID=A0ABD1GG01_SALDI
MEKTVDVQNQNSSLTSEEKSSNSSENVLLPQQTKQLSTTSDHAQEVNKLKQKDVEGEEKSDRKEESPSLPSPQKPKEQPFTEGKSSLDENVPKSENVPQTENSSAATATATPQKIESQPKENMEPVSELNVNETLASNETKKDILHSPSPTEQKENGDLVINKITASSYQVIHGESHGHVHEEGSQDSQHYVIVEMDDSPNGGATAPTAPLLALPMASASRTIHKQAAVCIQCSKLVTEEVSDPVLNIMCKCSDTSLLHLSCKDAWSQLKGDKCSQCDQKIKVKSVRLRSFSPQTNSDNSQDPEVTTWKRSWCCWHD